MGGSFREAPFSFTPHPFTASFHSVRPSSLGILGLGAIGGSLALEAKRAGIATVLGWSPDPVERATAAQRGAIDDAPARATDVARAVELLVLAAPPAANFLAGGARRGASFGPGARDATRLAASDATLWTEIFLMNRDQLLPALRALEEPLGQLERALEAGDAAALRSWLTRAADWRRRLDA